LINEWEYGLADKGYQGAPKLLTPFKCARGKSLSEEEEAANALISTIRILIERDGPIQERKLSLDQVARRHRFPQDRIRSPRANREHLHSDESTSQEPFCSA